MRRTTFAVLAIVSLMYPGICRAQTSAAPSAANGLRIAGRVIDEVTGAPLGRVTVSVLTDEYNQLMGSVVTDAEGNFALDHIPAGKYPLSAAKRGYRTSFYDEHDSYNSAIVTGADQDTSHLVFHLAPEAILRGLVTDDGGDPVEGARVMLFRKPAAGGAHLVQAVNGNTETDDTGAYEFNNLQPGQYLIAVKADPWYAQHDNRPAAGGQQSPLDVAYPVTYYDSTMDEASATALTLVSGSREEADINLHAVPSIHLRIPVTPGTRGQSAYLSVEQKVFGNVVNSERIQAGDPSQPAVEITGVAPGTYDLEYGDPPRRATVNASSNIDVDPNAGTPMLSVSGKLVMAGGGPVPDVVGLALVSPDEGQQPAQTFAGKDQFNFNAVPPGTWTLNASSSKGVLAVIATSIGGSVTAGDKLVVRDHPVSVVVTLSAAQTRLQGFARINGKGVSGVLVLLVPREPGSWPALMRTDQSDSDGSFNLRGVPTGRFTVIAIQDGWKLDWQSRDAIAPYLRSGVPVTINDQSGPVVSLAQPVQAVAR
jgi:protocatechuate 3,4-dioxygenase beta subunit